MDPFHLYIVSSLIWAVVFAVGFALYYRQKFAEDKRRCAEDERRRAKDTSDRLAAQARARTAELQTSGGARAVRG